MARGKEKCRILKDIRRRIAEANGIEYVTSECRYKGDCAGTCPKCEAEVRYLEAELHARRLLGKAVVLAGVSAGVAGLAGCCERSAASERIVEQQAGAEKGEKCMLFIDSSSMDQSSHESVDTIVVHGEEVIIDCDDHEPDPNIVYTVVSEKAMYPEGSGELIKFLSQNLCYPRQALDEKIEGVVVLKFVVDTLGDLSNFEIIRHADPLLEAEALRLVKTLPKFIPAKYKGVKVKSWVTVPVRFRLPKEGRKEGMSETKGV